MLADSRQAPFYYVILFYIALFGPPIFGLVASLKNYRMWAQAVPLLGLVWFFISTRISNQQLDAEAKKYWIEPGYYRCKENYGYKIDIDKWLYYYDESFSKYETAGALDGTTLTVNPNHKFSEKDLARFKNISQSGNCVGSQSEDLSLRIRNVIQSIRP